METAHRHDHKQRRHHRPHHHHPHSGTTPVAYDELVDDFPLADDQLRAAPDVTNLHDHTTNYDQRSYTTTHQAAPKRLDIGVQHAIDVIQAACQALPNQLQRHKAIGTAIAQLIHRDLVKGISDVAVEAMAMVNHYSYIVD
jgi:hypothetical protein